jgi:L-asparaginase
MAKMRPGPLTSRGLAKVPSAKRLLLLHTGGTVGMRPGKGGALLPAGFARALKTSLPELGQLAQVELELFANLDSSDLSPEHWARLAARLHQRLPSFDGAVVTHGTDTMAYTASALSFMLPGLPRPVVLTGAQRPLGEVRSDARLNLVDAFTAALQGPPEVMVCFDSKLFRGNRTTKVKVDEYDAFESPNHPLLGTLGVHIHLRQERSRRRAFMLRERLSPRVFLLKLFPGIDPAVCLGLLPNVEGLVVEAFGAGNFPLGASGRSLLPIFEEARARQIPVVLTSQAHRNGVDLDLYEAGSRARALGALSAADMTTEACVVKLMHALAYGRTIEGVRKIFERDLAGERTP